MITGPGLWSSLGEPHTAVAAARSGFSWTALDAQHGRWTDDRVGTALALLDPAVPTLVRVRSADPALVGRALDLGAGGVIVPLVSDVATAAAMAAASLYPPRGSRSWGPIAGGYADPTQTADPLCAVMIETADAVAAAPEIAAVPGVGMLFVGPFDLALALGIPIDALLEDGAVLAGIAAAAREAGIATGGFAGDPDRAARLRELGFDAVAVATDAALLARGAAAVLR